MAVFNRFMFMFMFLLLRVLNKQISSTHSSYKNLDSSEVKQCTNCKSLQVKQLSLHLWPRICFTDIVRLLIDLIQIIFERTQLRVMW